MTTQRRFPGIPSLPVVHEIAYQQLVLGIYAPPLRKRQRRRRNSWVTPAPEGQRAA